MTDERFKVDYEVGVLDTKTNEIICDTLNAEEVVALLNRQDYAIEVKQKYIEKLEKQLEQIPKSIREVWLE